MNNQSFFIDFLLSFLVKSRKDLRRTYGPLIKEALELSCRAAQPFEWRYPAPRARSVQCNASPSCVQHESIRNSMKARGLP
jgi:hypothetical protein